ncbi:MAG: DUF4331 domain-containing protein [Actinobacteria bacterium]|nr:DUF4331 domain-containing protein [Actinomycetota bacterium]
MNTVLSRHGSARRVGRALVAAGLAVAGTGLALGPGTGTASSHREAPLTAANPLSDNVDTYSFVSPDKPDTVTLIATWIPFQDPAGGPNFYPWGANGYRYNIKVDTNGDAKPDITYRWTFTNIDTRGTDTFLYNTGAVNSFNDEALRFKQTYKLEKIGLDGASETLVDGAKTAPSRVGDASMPNYGALRDEAVQPVDRTTGTSFVAQADDPFFVDLGSAFDLLGLRPLNPAHVIPLPAEAGVDGVAGKNGHSIALQLPITAVSKNGTVPTTVNDKDSVIGVYASSSRQRVRVLTPAGGTPRVAGRWVQVSRLGLPLVNEVLIPLGLKDKWNATRPADDAQFFPQILDPEPAKLIPVLYPGVTTPQGGFNADGSPRRSDIVAVLQGAASGLTGDQLLPPADLLRLNLATPVTAPGSQQRLGFLAGDADGFPNGRRLVDDVVDIELRLIAGGTPLNPEFNKSPNNALTDGVDGNDRPFLGEFPYVSSPRSGYDQPPTG